MSLKVSHAGTSDQVQAIVLNSMTILRGKGADEYRGPGLETAADDARAWRASVAGETL